MKKEFGLGRLHFWTEVASAAAGGIGAAIVSEVGSGIREFLSDRRQLAAEKVRVISEAVAQAVDPPEGDD